MLVNPCALIALANKSASAVAPVATNDKATPASKAACPTLLSPIVKLNVPAANVLAVIAFEVMVVDPDTFLAKIVKSNSSFSASVVCA